MKEEIIKNANIPDFKKAGFEILVFTISSHLGNIDAALCRNPNVTFSIISKTDHATMALYKEFSDAKKGMELCSSCLKETEKPERIIIPLEQLEYFRFDFVPLIKKLFKLNVDY